MNSGVPFPRSGGRFASLVAFLLLLPSLSGAQPGTAPTGDPGGFGIDGELDPGTPVAGTIDWNTVIMANGLPTSSATLHAVDGFSNSDLSFFLTTSRLFENPNTTWQWDNSGMTNPLNGKDNFSNGVAHFSRDGAGHLWLTWGVDREGAGTSSYMDLVLFQNTLVRNGNNTFSSTGPDGGHTVGDVALSLEVYASSAALSPSLAAWRWTQVAPGTYNFTSLALPPGAKFTAANNGFQATVPYTAFGSGFYNQDRFAEASVDLTALLASVQPSATFRTLFFVSRFGPDIESVLRDFIEPIPIQITTGVEPPFGPGGTRILGIRPNPTQGPVSVDLELAREGAVSLEFFDLSGRRVGAVTRGSLPPGRHTLTWEPAMRTRGGVLFARLAGEPGADLRRFVLLR